MISAIDLGQLFKIRVGHDNSGAGPGWFLEKIVVNGTEFPCSRWFDKKEDDGQISRVLFTTDNAQMLHSKSLHVSVKTGDMRPVR